MPKKNKINIESRCIKCDSVIESMSVQCDKCRSQKCRGYGCDNTATIHQHIYSREWYCITCAKSLNEESDRMGITRCFDLF